MSVLVLDTECTDRDEGREIIEVAWLKLNCVTGLLGREADEIPPTLNVEERFMQRYKPVNPTKYGALAVHHILPSELEGCPASSAFMLPDDADYIVGHSIDFDWEAIGSPTHVKRICTHAMAQNLWPTADSHSQSALLYMLLGATDATRSMVRQSHGALADVHMNLVLLGEILKMKPDIKTWSALHAFSEHARIPLVMPLGRNRGVLISDLESSEMNWYLDRDFIDPYLRKAFEAEIERRWQERPGVNAKVDADVDDDIAS